MIDPGAAVTVRGLGKPFAATVIEDRGSEIVVRTDAGKRRAVSANRVILNQLPTTKLRKLERLPVDAPYEASKPIAKESGARDNLYLKFVRAHPCACCGAPGPCEAHHWGAKGRSGGMGTKPSDFRTVPLCTLCHEHFHRSGHLPAMDRPQTETLFLGRQVDLLDAWASAEDTRRP